MDNLLQELMNQLSGGGLSKISQQIGADEKTTDSALAASISVLTSALAKNATDPNGAQALHNALTKDHDGSILDNMDDFLGDPEAAHGDGILRHVLGQQQPAVAQGLAKGTGLDISQIGQLLKIVAPLLMGAMGKQQQQQRLDPGSLTDFLGNQKQMAQRSAPNLLGMLNNLLDADKDGSALDDVLGMFGKLMGGR